LPFWQSVADRYEPLPSDQPEAQTLMKDIQRYALELEESLTTALLQKVNFSYHTEINDILLSALAQTISEWADQSQVVIGLEGHGREDLFADLDTSSTVGWFTNLYPVALEVEKGQSVGMLIKTVKEQLRNVPSKGMGYGLLRYLHPDQNLRSSLSGTKWDIVFNYLGQYDNQVNEESTFGGASENAGSTISDQYAFDAKLDINGMITDGQLNLTWSYSSTQYDTATIEQLAKNYLANLTTLIEHCVAKTDNEKTASDYGLAPMVKTKALDAFLNRSVNGVLLKDQVSTIYPLSPVQEGMLFHGLYDESSKAYTMQYQFDLNNGVDLEAFKTAFEYVMGNHSILRTAFFADQLSIPVQCVFEKVALPFEVLDYSILHGAALEREIRLFLEQDHQKGFDFSVAPLTRITFLKLSEHKYKMIWTCHHILIDGWSTPVIMEELLTAYGDLLAGKTLVPKTEDLFEDYIHYINARDEAEEETFWTNYLEDFQQASLLPFVASDLERNKGVGEQPLLDLNYDSEATERIRHFAQQNHLTVNTLVQGIWSLLLSTYTGQNTTTFGVTVSGRPGSLVGAEERVGMFINTIPLYANNDPEQSIIDWLSQIQNGHTAAREFQYTAQTSIQNWLEIKGDFFDSIIVFENYPIDEALNEENALDIDIDTAVDDNNYLLTIMVDLGATLNVKFGYYNAVLEDRYAELIKGHFAELLEQIVAGDRKTLGALNCLSEADRELLVQLHAATPLKKEAAVEKTFVAPRNETEEKLAAIWAKLLDKTAISIHDDFFEIGGHSLLAMRVKTAIRVAFGLDIGVKALFDHKTIAELAPQVASEKLAAALPPITKQEKGDRVPLSFA
ncbi:MAG: condensation domain-containing protein, partial [Bacteroidota bacterium]